MPFREKIAVAKLGNASINLHAILEHERQPLYLGKRGAIDGACNMGFV